MEEVELHRYPKGTAARHQAWILEFYGFTGFRPNGRLLLAEEIARMVQSQLKPKLVLWRCGRVRAPPGSQSGKARAIAAGGHLPSSGDSTGVDSQAGKQREATPGHPHGARPGSASGAPGGAGADLRAGLRGP